MIVVCELMAKAQWAVDALLSKCYDDDDVISFQSLFCVIEANGVVFNEISSLAVIYFWFYPHLLHSITCHLLAHFVSAYNRILCLTKALAQKLGKSQKWKILQSKWLFEIGRSAINGNWNISTMSKCSTWHKRNRKPPPHSNRFNVPSSSNRMCPRSIYLPIYRWNANSDFDIFNSNIPHTIHKHNTKTMTTSVCVRAFRQNVSFWEMSSLKINEWYRVYWSHELNAQKCSNAILCLV